MFPPANHQSVRALVQVQVDSLIIPVAQVFKTGKNKKKICKE